MLYLSMAALAAVLLLFAWIGLRARSAEAGLDDFVTARNSQNARAIGLSFLASGMGGWILFAPPEVGALVGPLALAGYALGAALPFALFAALGPAIRRALPQGQAVDACLYNEPFDRGDAIGAGVPCLLEADDALVVAKDRTPWDLSTFETATDFETLILCLRCGRLARKSRRFVPEEPKPRRPNACKK